MMIAAAEGHVQVVQLLLNAGATVNDISNHVSIIAIFALHLLFSLFTIVHEGAGQVKQPRLTHAFSLTNHPCVSEI